MKLCKMCSNLSWENDLCRDHLGRDTIEDFTCLFDGCNKTEIKARGYCKNHHNYMRKHNLLPLKQERKCEVENCGAKHATNGFCPKHYQRYLTHGGPHIVKPRGPKKGWKNEKPMQQV